MCITESFHFKVVLKLLTMGPVGVFLSTVIYYYNLQILLLSVSFKYSILNKVAVCHVKGVEKKNLGRS